MERSLLLPLRMADNNLEQPPREIEEQGATEDQMQKIDAIVGDEVLGYEGAARGEHSGQDNANEGSGDDALEDRLADNRPDQMK